jgi:hypothetical protein
LVFDTLAGEIRPKPKEKVPKTCHTERGQRKRALPKMDIFCTARWESEHLVQNDGEGVQYAA